jgi:hypothetical protein
MKSWKQISLRARILLLLVALVLTSMAGGLVAMWHSHQMDHLFSSVLDTAVIAIRATQRIFQYLAEESSRIGPDR